MDSIKLILTREATFSSGHRFWLDDLTQEENESLFGKFASRFNHGHNYRLQASVTGEMSPHTGMVVNLKALDGLLQTEIVNRFHLKSLNDEVPELKSKVPTLENLLAFTKAQLADQKGEVNLNGDSGQTAPIVLTQIRIYEMPDLWADWTEKMTTITRSYEFAAAHRLHISQFSEAENQGLFGKCNNPNGHGHNYVLEVSLTGDLNPQTGMMVNLFEMDQIIETEVIDQLDHKNLDLDVAGLSGLPSTTENLTLFIDRVLVSKFGKSLKRVKLFETARSSFEVTHE